MKSLFLNIRFLFCMALVLSALAPHSAMANDVDCAEGYHAAPGTGVGDTMVHCMPDDPNAVAPQAVAPAAVQPAPVVVADKPAEQPAVKPNLSLPVKYEVGLSTSGAVVQGAGIDANWVPCGKLFKHDVCAVLGIRLGNQFATQAGVRIPVKHWRNGRVTLDLEVLARLGINFPVSFSSKSGANHVVVPLTGQADVGVNFAPAVLDENVLRLALGLEAGGDLNSGSIANGSSAVNIGVAPVLSASFRFNENSLGRIFSSAKDLLK